MSGPKYAAKHGNFDEMKRMLQTQHGQGTDWAPASGWRCLHHAAEYGNRDAIDWLVQAGAVDAPLPGDDPKYPNHTAAHIYHVRTGPVTASSDAIA